MIGGTKVDAFIYSPLLSDYKGTSFDGIMHVSDWMPTILELAGISDYVPAAGFELDGVSQVADFTVNNGQDSSTYARQDMLYNMWTKIADSDWTVTGSNPTGVAAVRNLNYKLMYAYEDDADLTGWDDLDVELAQDDNFAKSFICSQSSTSDGVYTKYLFDIVNDPYETTNLYGNSEYLKVQVRRRRRIM